MTDAIAILKCPGCGGDQFIHQEVEIVTIMDAPRSSIYDVYKEVAVMVQHQYTCINPKCSKDLA